MKPIYYLFMLLLCRFLARTNSTAMAQRVQFHRNAQLSVLVDRCLHHCITRHQCCSLRKTD